MPKIDSEKFYISSLMQHGISPKGVNWLSKESQEIRFKVLLEMLPKDLSPFSLGDAGCGFGDLYLYMKKYKYPPKTYTGVDALEEMCFITHKHTRCETIVADICFESIPKKDFYVCSGAMNVLESFETHLFIRNCYESSKFGFVFNILHGEKNSQTYNYLTSGEIQEIAKSLGVTKVKLKNGYLDNDITVGFFKEVL